MLASAQVPHVLGDFAYKFTEENRAVFTVRSSGAKLNLVLNLNGKVVKVAALSKAGRKEIWDALDLEAEAGPYENAECVGTSSEYICYVPPVILPNKQVDKSTPSGFFHYDKVGGLTELRKLSK
jgi:hypothetical protein